MKHFASRKATESVPLANISNPIGKAASVVRGNGMAELGLKAISIVTRAYCDLYMAYLRSFMGGGAGESVLNISGRIGKAANTVRVARMAKQGLRAVLVVTRANCDTYTAYLRCSIGGRGEERLPNISGRIGKAANAVRGATTAKLGLQTMVIAIRVRRDT